MGKEVLAGSLWYKRNRTGGQYGFKIGLAVIYGVEKITGIIVHLLIAAYKKNLLITGKVRRILCWGDGLISIWQFAMAEKFTAEAAREGNFP